MPRIEIYQETTHLDVAEVEIGTAEAEHLRSLQLTGSKSAVQDYLTKLVEDADAEWEDGGFVDGNLPHQFDIDGEPYIV